MVSTIKHSTNHLHFLVLINEETMLAMGSRNIHIWDMAMASKKVTKTLDRSC